MPYELFSADVCPFAQRTRALLTELDEPFELRVVDLEDRDPELLALSPTGRVPLLVEREEVGRGEGEAEEAEGQRPFVLYESAVINEYLAEKHQYARAFATTLQLRSRQRLAMKQWDDVVAPAWYASLTRPEVFAERRESVEKELAVLAAVVEDSEADPKCLLGFHVAPFWARMTWTRELSPLLPLDEAHGDLVRWLDATMLVDSVQATLPDREATVARYEARAAAARGTG